MYLLGWLSLIQISILPGLIFVSFFKIKESFITTAILILLCSLIINYIGVFFLVSCGIYYRNIIFSIFIIETVLAIWIFLTKKNFCIDNTNYRKYIIFLVNRNIYIYIINIFIISLFIYCLLFYIDKHVYGNIGNVFKKIDAVVSWNRWAIDWYNNKLPTNTWEYPQLLPSVWSVTYKFLGTEKIQFYAKGIMPIFGLINILILGQLASDYKRIEFLVAGIIYLLFLENVFPSFIDAGYADIAISAFSLMAVYCLLIARLKDNNEYSDKIVVLGFIISGGALVVKQTGIAIAFAYPFLAWFFIYKNRNIHFSLFFKKMVFGTFIVLFISLPWYGYKIYQLSSNKSNSNLQVLVKDIHEGRNYIERADNALIQLNKELQRRYARYARISLKDAENNKVYIDFFIYIFIFIVFLGLLNFQFSIIHFFYTLPAFFLWLFLFSYDLRNMQPSVPFLSMSAAFGIFYLPRVFSNYVIDTNKSYLYISDYISKNVPKSFFIHIIIVIIFIFGLTQSYNYPDQRLLSIQKTKQMQIGDTGLNDMIYNFHKINGINGKVLTSYQMLAWLPGLESKYLSDHYRSYNSFLENVDLANYFLFNKDKTDLSIISYVEKKVYSGEYILLFEYNSWVFIQKISMD